MYLQDFLQALIIEYPDIQLSVFNKLDTTNSQPPASLTSNNINYYYSGNIPSFLRTAYFAFQLFSQSLIHRPSLIVCGLVNFAPVALWVHRLTGIPYWIVVYGVDAWEITDPSKKQALHCAQKIISISGYTRERLIKEQGLEYSKIPLLPVTFDADRFKVAPKPAHLLEKYSLKPDRPIILTVARLDNSERYKGYDQILLALPEIRQQIPNIHYLIVGKGSDRPRIEQLIHKLDLQDCVTLAGFIPDEELGDHYNLCDVFAMPSKGEGFGIVYLEALACGKPTLGGNQDGANDALCHGKLGALVDPDNIHEIAQTLIQILQGNYPNPLMYQPDALRQQVVDIYGFDRFKQTLSSLFEDWYQQQ